MNPYDDFKISERELPSLNRRQYKLLLANGIMLKNKTPITTPEKLKAWLVKNQPIKAYVSNSIWLAPNLLEGKKLKGSGYNLLSKCFLGSDLFFDFDKDQYDFEQVKKDALRIIDFMKDEKNFTLRRIQFSGSQGLHLIYNQEMTYFEEDPIKRLKLYETERQSLMDKLPKLKTWDRQLTKDQFRIYKIPNTYDFTTGYKIQEISEEELRNKSFDDILNNIPTHSLESPFQDNDLNRRSSKRRLHELGGEKRSRLSLPPQYKFMFIPNKVYGVEDRFVPFILLKKGAYSDEKLKQLQREYSLGSMYVFDYQKFYGIICLKTLSKRRLLKIYRKINSETTREFMRKGFNKIRTSQIMDASDKILVESPKLVKVLEADKVNGYFSKPHFNYLKSMVPINYENLIGVDFKFITEANVDKEAQT